MNAPAQILTALVAAGAAAFLPLSSRIQEAGLLRQKVNKRADAARAAAALESAASGSAAGGAGAEKSAFGERIPAPVSAADASRIIMELKALDGKMMSSRRMVELIDSVMSLPESHMTEAQAAIEAQKNMVLSGFLCSALFSRWGELNPDGARVALETASKSGNIIVKFAGAASLAGGWMEKDPDAFIKWVSEKKEGEGKDGDEMRRVMMEAALHGMANVDSATAEKLIQASPKDRRPWMIMDMAEGNPDIDPKDAAARAMEEAGEDSGQRNSIHWRLGRMLAEKDPQEAIKYAETLKPEERNNYYESAFSSWLKKDKAEAMKWIGTQPEDVQKNAIRGARFQLDDMSYDETVKMADTVSRPAGEELWFSALNEKARKDPKEALTYLPNVAEDKRHFGYNEIANEWTKKDATAASEWIDGLEAGKQKDYAIQGMVQELHSKDPSSSTIWAASVGDEQMRERLVQENAKLWLKRDRPAAEEWINGSTNLSDEFKDKLLVTTVQMSTFKKWLPFTVTLVIALAAAAGIYIWKGSEIDELEGTANAPVIRPAATDAQKKPVRTAAKSKSGPELSGVESSLRPTRNGMRSLFERAKHIMDLDQEHVLKLLDELEAGGRIRSPITGVNLMAAYARLAELDPQSAMQRVMAQKGETRDIALATVMNEWLARDRKGALAWFAKSEDMETKKKYLTIASFANGSSDPELIADLSAAVNDPEASSKALLDSIGALAFSDPDAALKKLNEIQDPEQREKAGERVYEGFLMRYPQKALDYAMAQAPGDKARENARNSLVRWGEQDASGALKWLTTQSKEVQKELFDTGSENKGPGWGFGKASIEEIGTAARQLGDKGQQDKLYAAWANSQSWSKPSDGLNQLHQIKDPELQKSTAASIGMSAAQSGKIGDMSAWVADAIPNDTRDTAVASFATGMAQKDPALAREWAGKITNGTIRQETLNALKNPPPAETLQSYPGPGRRR